MSVSAPFRECGGCHFDGHGGDEQARAEPSLVPDNVGQTEGQSPLRRQRSMQGSQHLTTVHKIQPAVARLTPVQPRAFLQLPRVTMRPMHIGSVWAQVRTCLSRLFLNNRPSVISLRQVSRSSGFNLLSWPMTSSISSSFMIRLKVLSDRYIWSRFSTTRARKACCHLWSGKLRTREKRPKDTRLRKS